MANSAKVQSFRTLLETMVDAILADPSKSEEDIKGALRNLEISDDLEASLAFQMGYMLGVLIGMDSTVKIAQNILTGERINIGDTSDIAPLLPIIKRRTRELRDAFLKQRINPKTNIHK